VSASAIYVGEVTHRRFRPKQHFLRYGVFQVVVDIDELAAEDRRLRLFAHNRPGVFSIRDRDHGHLSAGSIRDFAETALAEAGVDLAGGRILMQCMPRVLGFVFNPITLYYCHDADGHLAAMIYEVHNTFGQRHSYVAPCAPRPGDGQDPKSVAQSCAKTFHVSPFMGMEMTYAFVVRPPGETVATVIRGSDRASGEALIHATFTGARREMTDGHLLRLLLAYPLMTLGVVAAIHFEALKLALKGLRLRPKPPSPSGPVTVAAAG
jgi:DUF1365 family protein